MKFEDVHNIVNNVPHMSRDQGKLIFDLICDNKLLNILELGTAHGTGTCYMAAALDELGNGKIKTVDLDIAYEREPNVIELSKKCGLDQIIDVVFTASGYNWELLKEIKTQTSNGICEPVYDLIYLDGSHKFEIDCCAFFLANKLLKPGGYFLFDDLNWSYATSPSLKDLDWVKKMPEDERTTPQIKQLVDYIVLNHPEYHNPSIVNNWFMIQKRGGLNSKKIELNSYKVETSILTDTKALVRKSLRKLKGN